MRTLFQVLLLGTLMFSQRSTAFSAISTGCAAEHTEPAPSRHDGRGSGITGSPTMRQAGIFPPPALSTKGSGSPPVMDNE